VRASTNGSSDPNVWTWSFSLTGWRHIEHLRPSGEVRFNLVAVLFLARSFLRRLLGYPSSCRYITTRFAQIRRVGLLGVQQDHRFAQHAYAQIDVDMQNPDSFSSLTLQDDRGILRRCMLYDSNSMIRSPGFSLAAVRLLGDRSLSSFGGMLPAVPAGGISFVTGIPFVTEDNHAPNVLHFPGKGRHIFGDFLNGLCESDPGVPPGDITVITFTDSEARERESPLPRQLRKVNVPFVNAGLRFQRDKGMYGHWRNYLKCKYLCETLPTVTTEYVLILDADDVAIQRFDGILDNFREYNLPVLFGATLSRFPDMEIDVVKNRGSLGPFKNLNAGTCIGETRRVLEFYRRCCVVEPEEVLLNRGEQHTVRQVFNECQNWVGFDHRSRVFQLFGAISGRWTDIMREDGKFVVKVVSAWT